MDKYVQILATYYASAPSGARVAALLDYIPAKNWFYLVFYIKLTEVLIIILELLLILERVEICVRF